jgi:hypothetical protein
MRYNVFIFACVFALLLAASGIAYAVEESTTVPVPVSEGSIGIKANVGPGKIRTNASWEGSVVAVNETGGLTEREMTEYRADLNLSQGAGVDAAVAAKAVERKAKDSGNYERLRSIVMDVPEADRERLLGELVDMDQNFTDRLAQDYENNPGAVKQQIDDYVGAVEGKIKVQATVSRPGIADLLTGRVGLRAFILSIFM